MSRLPQSVGPPLLSRATFFPTIMVTIYRPLATPFVNQPDVTLGGIDTYIQEFGISKTHDEFYSSATIQSFFKNYTTAVISRFINNTAILAWELANDPRCSSTVSASGSCVTTTVTQWHVQLARHVRSIDPNHLITSGSAYTFFPLAWLPF
jgi:endo-1,4-beta-mannosidase